MPRNVQRTMLDGYLRFAVAILLAVAILPVLIVGMGHENILRDQAPATQAANSQDVAKALIDRSGIRRGLCVVLGGDRSFALEVAKASEFLTYVREPNADRVAELRAEADEAGFGIDRFVVEQGELNQLPFADNMIDVLIASKSADNGLDSLSLKEILRVLRPEGTTFIGSRHDATSASKEELEALVGNRSRGEFALKDGRAGRWVQISKPPLEGADDWSHWEHGPDNNPVSSDTVIKAPYMTQFLAKPFYIGMPSITTAAGGRTFLAIGHIAHHRREWDGLNRIIARNGYNGTVLWERPLPEGYLTHRSAFIATKDAFHMIDGDHCLLLDPETGEDKGEIRIPELDGEWKWMVMHDGVLYVLAGDKENGSVTIKGDRTFGGWSWGDLSKGYYGKPRVPWGFGHTLAAYDFENKQLLWKHSEQKPIDSRAMSIGNNRVFLYCPEAHIRSLDAKTGKLVWTNNDSELLALIEEPGKKLTSTPGFRSACLSVFTPDALIIQGQTRMNVVAVSTADGYMLWNKKKITNNPNAIFVDGNVVLGVGKNGSHVVVEPSTGNVLEDLKFRKTACTRLTASSDSFFCRGEGTLRFDRSSKKLLIDGAIRPACNDGAIPANGLLYLGPWQCDCNLSLIGNMARCSAGDFQFDRVATEADRLQVADDADQLETSLKTTAADWPTYRGNNSRSSSTSVSLPTSVERKWALRADREYVPTAPTASGGLVFLTGSDGKVRAIDAESGSIRWEAHTAGPIRQPASISDGRAYIGSGDGYVYVLEAATGRLLWRFRAAPVERHIMVYGAMNSTWPVNSGVLVEDGIAYFGAGIIDHDGTYLYAVDAKTGKIVWQNNSSGHLNAELRKGVSVQGNLTISGDQLVMAGGNQVSPARFNLQTGECLAELFDQGRPKANHGRFIGAFGNEHVVVGGRILFSAAANVSSKGNFAIVGEEKGYKLNFGGIPPVWDENVVALVNYLNGKLTCIDTQRVRAQMEQGYRKRADGRRQWDDTLAEAIEEAGGPRWQSDLGESHKFEAVAMVICPNAIVSLVQYQHKHRAHPEWHVVAFAIDDGKRLWRHSLDGAPLPDGLLVDRDGQVVVTMLNGDVLCFGAK